MEKKVITILFSRYHTFMANFLHIVSGRGYTHASIALDEDDEYFYSFNSTCISFGAWIYSLALYDIAGQKAS